MGERYWNAGEAPDAVLDWVSKEVEEAFHSYWEDYTPITWCDDVDGRLVIVAAGPDKPEVEGAPSDIYTINVDILAPLTDWSEPYRGIGGPKGDAQREDVLDRAKVLRKLAAYINDLAESLESEARKE